ncbi:adenosine deaminase-like protein isoform X2 [Brachypodium distachyon]|uniref:adenosine deaminase-like protein isoform X2 n=1 Tax=Brachypodium distachyon TaxID=15368 RepID=UPI0001C757C9|nr:adenosine deaminase-like protein isoform X2 [Brachypodium distachyon]|eukprot:XP_014752733.2 adenosine deaminase-like protein isoform X2 [Brachypodium distachyon]
MEAEMREWCVALPKVELHAHLNGSVRDSTLLELAKQLGDRGVIVFEDVKDVIMKNGRSLPECFKLFDLFHILTTDHDTVTRITKEVVGDFAAENVVYLEIRTTPKNNEAKGMTKRSYMNAVLKGLKAVEDVDAVLFDSILRPDETLSRTPVGDLDGVTKKKKIYVRLLLSIDRRETTSAALDTVNLAMEMKDQGVVGIDLSGNPVVGEWETYLPALEHAKELGIPITIHCGEVPNRKEIQAVLDFCPQRLGHVCCLNDEEWKKLKSSMIPVEICLTSNVMTGGAPSLELHHFADLYNAKHPLSLCTDDSGLFSTSLSNEYYLVASTFSTLS